MSVIRILSTEIANRIAAGEVIERPASVVKELVENSIDAGARRIRVAVEEGGKKIISVSDDGCGMDRDDALLCLEPHATSKIGAAFDIDHIATLGFRGEALPSIAGVSKFRLQTRQIGAVAGVEVQVEGGTLRNVTECGCSTGTTISVANLFYNLPARRKFLRGADTEDAHIHEMILLLALAHPGIGFELVVNRQKAFLVPPDCDLRSRVGMLLGRELLAQMIPVEYSEGEISVHGFTARPGITRSSRREQRAIINGRPAVSDPVYFAIRDAYHTLVMKGRYPPAVLRIEMPPDQVDVNVHPTKREIRFRDGRIVAAIVTSALRRSLQTLACDFTGNSGGSTHPITAIPGRPSRLQQDLIRTASSVTAPAFIMPTKLAHQVDSQPAAVDNTSTDTDFLASSQPTQETFSPYTGTEQAPDPSGGTSPSAATRPQIRALRVIGVYKTLYLIAEGSAGLVLIDQHAAHERILFEQLLANAKTADGAVQTLLIPLTIELTPADADFLKRNLDKFLKLGFELEHFGGNAFLATGIPAHFPQDNIAGMLHDMLDELRNAAGGVRRPDEIRIAQAACKHAVKAEDALTMAEIEKLLESLAAAEMPYTCPHGRPVMINIPDIELQKRFGRRP